MHEDEIGKLTAEIQDIQQRFQEHSKTMDDLRNLAIGIARIDGEVKCIKNDVQAIKEGVKQNATRPRMWLDKIIAAGIGAVTSGIVAAILSQVLK